MASALQISSQYYYHNRIALCSASPVFPNLRKPNRALNSNNKFKVRALKEKTTEEIKSAEEIWSMEGNVTATAPAPTPTSFCIKVDGCALDLITSVFKRRISLSTQCCQGLSTISDDCFYKEFTYSKRVPFFLGKVRNYCSHAINTAASEIHAAPSPSSISPPHTAPTLAPTSSCIKVKGCAIGLITSVFKRKILLSKQCCQQLLTTSDECFYNEFTHSKRVPFFLGKVRNYCRHHQG